MPADKPRTDTIDILRRVAGAAAVHIYEMEWLDDGTDRLQRVHRGGRREPDRADRAGARTRRRPGRPRCTLTTGKTYNACGEALQRGEPQEMEYRLVGSDGRHQLGRGSARGPRFENTAAGSWMGIVADITERRRSADELIAAQARLAHLAYHDALTDLPNRLPFSRSTSSRAIRTRTHRGNLAVAVLFVDLDDFKLINDSHGHADGDELVRVAGRPPAKAAGPTTSSRGSAATSSSSWRRHRGRSVNEMIARARRRADRVRGLRPRASRRA